MLHPAGEMLNSRAGIKLVRVPYKGVTNAFIDLLGGQISIMFPGAPIALPQVKTGKLRGLASTGPVRNPATPDLPTIGEVYPGYEALSWHAVFVPPGTPQLIIERLQKEIAVVLKQPKFAERLANTGSGEPYSVTPQELTARMKRDYEKYGKLIRSIGIKVE